MNAIEAQGLDFDYPDGTPALRGVSFAVDEGESIGLVGANGAGKTTLLHHLNGGLAPRAGTLRIAGAEISKENLADIRRRVGMIFQDSDDQLFMPTVFEDVAFGPLNLGIAREDLEARVMNALETVGAGHLRARMPHHLSGGEKRAVAIAGVLAMQPDILVLDEPSSNLDPWARRQLIALLQSFAHTKIIATHDLDLVMDCCPRTIVMRDGRVLADGPTAQIFNDAALLASCRLEKPLRLQGCPACNGKLVDRGVLPQMDSDGL